MTTLLISAVNLFIQILIYLIIGRAILSWFVRNPYDTLGRIYTMVCQVTEPMLAPCRRLLGRFNMMGTIDLSPVLALIGLEIIRRIILNILWTLRF